MRQKQRNLNRWLRALEIAKIMFEDEGYHTEYLQGIELFIRRRKMYSPKIKEDLIAKLYQLARAQKKPMTRLVDSILREVVNNHQCESDKQAASSLDKAIGENTS
jgi:hypothetical protein